MKSKTVLLGLACGVLVVACQSAPKVTPAAEAPKPAPVAEVVTPAPVVPEPTPEPTAAPDRIDISRDGFSPLASPPNHTLTVTFHWGDPAKLVEWVLLFAAEGSEPVRTLRGTEALPFVDWDGKTDSGVLAPHGRYQAILKTTKAGVLVEQARSLPFLLDIVPPSGSITVSPASLVLGPASVIVDPPAKVTIGLTLVSGDAPWTTWRLAVVHPDGKTFREDFINENHRDNQIVWDGRAINNAQLEAGVTYGIQAEVYDVYGNKGVIKGTLPVEAAPVAAPVAVPAVVATPEPAPVPPPVVTTMTVTLDGKVLAELPLFFPPYSADLGAVSGAQKEANTAALQKLASLLLEAAQAEVKVVGHANQVLYQDPVKAAYEQRETLIPLSLARAEAVRNALTSSGVSASSLLTTGIGAAQPVVPFSDEVNRWKNRRVVLELVSGGPGQ